MILRKLDDAEGYSEVLPLWKGSTAVVLGGGPSLSPEQFEQVREAREAGLVRCIAVNDAYLLAPWADVHYAADAHWHRWHTEGIDKPLLHLTAEQVKERWASFAGQKCSIQSQRPDIADKSVHILRNKTFPIVSAESGLSFDSRSLCPGRNSGFQASNLAVLAGVSTLLLLGIDARGTPAHSHWHGRHPRPMPFDMYEHIRRSFSVAERDFERAGVKVFNCSPSSRIESFEKITLAVALWKRASVPA